MNVSLVNFTLYLIIIFQGVFLHILADTLGSVGVIVSAILMQMFGWMIADPVCSIFIAVLIALSVGSLIAESVAILMQRSPRALDHSLPDAYQKVMQLEGVQGVHVSCEFSLKLSTPLATSPFNCCKDILFGSSAGPIYNNEAPICQLVTQIFHL